MSQACDRRREGPPEQCPDCGPGHRGSRRPAGRDARCRSWAKHRGDQGISGTLAQPDHARASAESVANGLLNTELWDGFAPREGASETPRPEENVHDALAPLTRHQNGAWICLDWRCSSFPEGSVMAMAVRRDQDHPCPLGSDPAKPRAKPRIGGASIEANDAADRATAVSMDAPILKA